MKKRMYLDGGGVEATESPSSVTLVMPKEIPRVETVLKKAPMKTGKRLQVFIIVATGLRSCRRFLF